MDTKAWGPGLWKFLHITSFNYPENPTPTDMAHYKALFLNLQYTLPCKYCRESYARFVTEIPIDPYLRSRKTLAYWLYKIHNKVNNKLRAQGNNVPRNPSFEAVSRKYNQYRAKCSNKTKSCRKPEPKSNAGKK